MPDKSTWWSVTAFDDEIKLLEDKTKYPGFVKQIFGGREICPKTSREHFQGALQCHAQQRFSAIKAWLHKAHIEPARQAEALKKYAMKTETASGDKLVRENPTKFFNAQEICTEIAKAIKTRQTDRQIMFWDGVNNLLRDRPELTGQLMNPSLKNWWVKTHQVWMDMAKRDSITRLANHDGCKHGVECGGCGNCIPIVYNGSEVQD